MSSLAERTIGVYNDFGTTTRCVKHLLACVIEVFPTCSVVQLSGRNLIDGSLDTVDMLCVGGGFSRGLARSMTEEGMRNVRQYVANGGKYLGLCSGAYFASRRTEFDVGGPLEVIDDEYLDIFDGIARGPIYRGYRYDSEAGSYAATVQACGVLIPGCPSLFTSYFNGGCEFVGSPWDRASVAYRYFDTLTPAILYSKVGLGKILLSGVHFEFDPFNMQDLENDPYSKRILPVLKKVDKTRRKFCKAVLYHLLSDNKAPSDTRFS